MAAFAAVANWSVSKLKNLHITSLRPSLLKLSSSRCSTLDLISLRHKFRSDRGNEPYNCLTCLYTSNSSWKSSHEYSVDKRSAPMRPNWFVSVIRSIAFSKSTRDVGDDGDDGDDAEFVLEWVSTMQLRMAMRSELRQYPRKMRSVKKGLSLRKRWLRRGTSLHRCAQKMIRTGAFVWVSVKFQGMENRAPFVLMRRSRREASGSLLSRR